MTRFRTRRIFLAAVVTVLGLLVSGREANACLPESHKHLSHHCVASPPLNRLLSVVLGEAARPRQIAVLAGVSKYPNLPAGLQLPPVDHDLRMLSEILIKRLLFDEVIILKNEDFSQANLRYIFEIYLPDSLQENPKSRVLFAFSGHGSDFDGSGFLYFPGTRTIKADRYSDLADAMNLGTLKIMMSPTMRNAHQFLALINACNGGYFLDVGMHFGANALEERGAHGITAGGARDAVNAYSNVGTGQGSVFFEMVSAALAGRDVIVGGRRFEDPAKEDGILTTTKLANFLAETIPIIENYRLSPRLGALTGRSAGNQGEFFFVTDQERAKGALSRRFPREAQRVFGTSGPADTTRDDSRNLSEQQRLAERLAELERRLAQQIAAREQEDRERAAREQAARDKAAREQEDRERAAREQAARDKAAREQEDRERAVREQATRDKAAREAREREVVERIDRARIEQEARESAAREQAERDRLTREARLREEADRTARERAADQARSSRGVLQSVAVRGNEYKMLPGTSDVEACFGLCRDDLRCKMFSYWENTICYLYDREFELHQNASAQSGYRQLSIMQSTAIRGNEYKMLSGTPHVAACFMQCKGEPRCKMFSYWENTVCYLYDREFATVESIMAQSGRVR